MKPPRTDIASLKAFNRQLDSLSETPRKRRKRGTGQPRTICVITGLRMGTSELAHQPLLLANIAYELGRVDRKTYLAEAAKLVKTKQPLGQLLSFHKKALVKGGFLTFESVPRTAWKKEQEAKAPSCRACGETKLD